MLSHHFDVFYSVADEYWCWIGLREPNPLSDQWIGKFGYVPKSLDCKAKTSDKLDFKFRGLVVDPTLCPEAFLNSEEAKATWTYKFLQNGDLPSGFSRDTQGPERGLVRHNGSKIHADYDLMCLVKASQDGSLAFTSPEEINELFSNVEKALNNQLGSKMIQHGTEFQFQGMGARESEMVLYFGPKRQFRSSVSSMSIKLDKRH